jgi:uncharacterized Fe-S center protein
MKQERQHIKQMTAFIEIDTRNCKACWKCISICPNQVISRINLFFHKHIRISELDKCIGCMKCMKVCEYKAIRPLDKTLNIINHGASLKKETV